MSKITLDKKVEEDLYTLSKKELEITSENGLITALVSGSSIYKKITINGNLKDMSKEDLEEGILSVVKLARIEVQKQLFECLQETLEEIQNETKKEDDNVINIENVS